MGDWNSEQYLKFKAQRTQPAQDLAARLRSFSPQTILDVGCGPANSTAVLHSFFPAARLTGIDTSPDMLEKARQKLPDAEFLLCDAHDIQRTYDIIFSNACLQWIPDHETLIPFLLEHVNAGGALAVQMPMNADEPLYRIIDDVAHEERWRFDENLFEQNRVFSPREYFDILSGASSNFDQWETVYYHALPSHAALLDWVRSTRLRPFLSSLDDATAQAFETEILCRAQKAYQPTASGEVILCFRRFFFVAKK